MENEQEALNQIEILKMELQSRDTEVEKAHEAFEKELQYMLLTNNGCFNEDHQNRDAEKGDGILQDVIDNALRASRIRNTEHEKVHAHLLKRFNSLSSKYTDLVEDYKSLQYELERYQVLVHDRMLQPDEKLEWGLHAGNHALLKAGVSKVGLQPATPPPQGFRERSIADSEPDPKWSPNSGSISSVAPLRPSKLNTSFQSISPERTPIETPHSAGHVQHFREPEPFTPGIPTSPGGNIEQRSFITRSGSGDSNTKTQTKKTRIIPEARIHGRGGVQNVGRKDTDQYEDNINNILRGSKGKAKEVKDTRPETPEPKKEKKTLGIKGIRGFM
jgi:hypothetical protein